MKRIDHHSRRRSGFSLIELFTVIAIIAVLLALSAGALFRVRNSQMRDNTTATMKKINGALDNRMKAIRDKAQEEIRNQSTVAAKNAISEALGDKDIALSLLLYAKMKNELPMTFAEAVAPTVVGSITLPPRGHFTTSTSIGTTTGPGSPEESGVCLYIALTSSAGDGAVAEGGWEQQTVNVSVNGRTFRAFGDAWGTPIAFVRQCYVTEVQGAPYVKGAAFDPFDPSPSHKAANLLATRWSANQIKPPTITGCSPPGAYSSGLNFLPTVISAGPNMKWGTDLFTGDDNLLGFRLREGTQGN